MIRHFWMSDVNRAVVDMAAPKPGERGLDVGAGMGPATVLAAKRGAHVVAVDPSGFMRAFCGFRRLLQRARRRITVESGVAEDLPVAGGSTEVLWAVNAVHHWVDHPAVWPEFARVLAPGGRQIPDLHRASFCKIHSSVCGEGRFGTRRPPIPNSSSGFIWRN